MSDHDGKKIIGQDGRPVLILSSKVRDEADVTAISSAKSAERWMPRAMVANEIVMHRCCSHAAALEILHGFVEDGQIAERNDRRPDRNWLDALARIDEQPDLQRSDVNRMWDVLMGRTSVDEAAEQPMLVNSAPGVSAKRKRGRKPIKTQKTMEAMRLIDHNCLRSMNEEEMAAKFEVSRDTARKARDAVLSEAV